MGRVAGKVALVTGGGSGLGAADCSLLAQEGATVIVTDVDFDSAREVAARIGGDATAMMLDVSKEADWDTVATEISSRYGRLDVLVNNAGIAVVADIEQTTLEDFRRVSSIMNEGVFLGCKYAVSLMRAGSGGSIVNMSSTTALIGYPAFLAYTAAKGAVRAMSRSIAVMCQEKGYKIRCNTILPGIIETPMIQRSFGRPGQEEPVPEGILPPGANGAPKDVASLVLYLASDESRFVTGAEFVIDNGVTIRG